MEGIALHLLSSFACVLVSGSFVGNYVAQEV